MQGKLINTVLGTLGVVAVGTAVWQFLNKEKQSAAPNQPVPNDVLIKFLKDLRAQTYHNFFMVSSIVQRIKSDNNQESFEQSFAKIKPEVELLFEMNQIAILCKHQLKKEDVQLSLELTQDQVVKAFLSEFMQLYEAALDGQAPLIDLDQRTINKYDAQKLLRIMAKNFIATSEVSCLAVEELVKNGSCPEVLKLDQPIFMKALYKNGLTEQKLAVLNGEGVAEFEKPDACVFEVFQKLTQYHKLQNPKLQQCVDNLDTAYLSIIKRLEARELQPEEARVAVAKINVDEFIQQLK